MFRVTTRSVFVLRLAGCLATHSSSHSYAGSSLVTCTWRMRCCRITRQIRPGTPRNDAASPPTSRRISPPLAKAFVLRNASSSPTTVILHRNPDDPFHYPTCDQVELLTVAD